MTSIGRNTSGAISTVGIDAGVAEIVAAHIPKTTNVFMVALRLSSGQGV
jgi:hypothetical protein